LANLDEIKQLKTGISDSGAGQGVKSSLVDNIFVIWNQQNGTKANAEQLLDLMLQDLKQEAKIIIPRDRVAIVNLRLALRAMQSKKIAMGGGIREHLKFVRTDELADRGENQRK
jgi:hypothetical protein